MSRNRLVYSLALLIVIIDGLPTRLLRDHMPPFMVDYAGDALWALAIFLGFGWLLPRARTRTIVLLSVVLTWGIEFSELYQADWINAIRAVGRPHPGLHLCPARPTAIPVWDWGRGSVGTRFIASI
jgi:hypothetical protein